MPSLSDCKWKAGAQAATLLVSMLALAMCGDKAEGHAPFGESGAATRAVIAAAPTNAIGFGLPREIVLNQRRPED
jgi:hypothetical protein